MANVDADIATSQSEWISSGNKKRSLSPCSTHFQPGLIIKQTQQIMQSGKQFAKQTLSPNAKRVISTHALAHSATETAAVTPLTPLTPITNFISRIKVNGSLHYINAAKLLELEPDTILITWDSFEYNTKYNTPSNTLEYLDTINFFPLINDYIKDYTPHKLLETLSTDKIHKTLTTNITKLIETVVRLKLYNLLKHINALYPSITIDDKQFTINIAKLKELEPYNILQKKIQTINSQQYLFRDCEIFTNIIHPYILGNVMHSETVQKINMLESDGIMYKKICDDLRFFNFVELWKAIKQYKIAV